MSAEFADYYLFCSAHTLYVDVLYEPPIKIVMRRILTMCVVFVSLICCERRKEIKDQLILDNETSQIQTSIETEGKHINALDLKIKGEINGPGRLSIGDNDSTFYKTYEVSEGKIEITYEGDWYSQYCYVTFKPVRSTSGLIEIQGDFGGD